MRSNLFKFIGKLLAQFLDFWGYRERAIRLRLVVVVVILVILFGWIKNDRWR
jgi:hypothetical protein